MNWWNARKNWRQFIWRSWIFQVGHVVEEVKVSYVVEMGVKSIANVCLLVLWVAMEPYRVLVAVGLWWSAVLSRLKLWYSACAGLFWCCCYCCIWQHQFSVLIAARFGCCLLIAGQIIWHSFYGVGFGFSGISVTFVCFPCSRVCCASCTLSTWIKKCKIRAVTFDL